MVIIGSNLQAVRKRIAEAAVRCGRNPDEIKLIAVSKGFDSDAITEACAAGQYVFGESYLQEALIKIAATAATKSDMHNMEWHFIGPIQSNKTRAIAENFAWVHSVERLKIAERLNAARSTEAQPLQICIEINLGSETSKSGVTEVEALELARGIAQLPRLKLRGLMAIPPQENNETAQRQHFARLNELKQKIVATGIALDTLSIGMSDDLEAAIAEGATMVRIGRAIFGQREVK